MHKIRNSLLILLTLVLLTTGAFLPQVLAMLQDRQLEKTSESRELNQVQLLIQQEMSTVQLLGLLGNEHTSLAWDASASLSEEEAMDYAFETAQFMITNGILSSMAIDASFNFTNHSFKSEHLKLPDWDAAAEPYLVISKTESHAAVLWKCTWKSTLGEIYTMWIDDCTRILCGMTRTKPKNSDTKIYTDSKSPYVYVEAADINELLGNWVAFINDYYGLRTYDFVETHIDDKQNSIALSLVLAPEESPKDTCTVRLLYEEKNISFII
ncbi:hypothetical protein ABXS75_15760 [Roseburia hominis]